MTHEQRHRALTLIAAAHFKACQRRQIKPPKKLLKLYPSLKQKRKATRRITRNEAIEIYALAWSGAPQADIMARFGVGQTRVSDIKHGRTWRQATKGLKRGGVP